MGHHIDSAGRFQSDKYPDLGPDRIIVSFKHPQARRALWALASGYDDSDPELAADIRTRLGALVDEPDSEPTKDTDSDATAELTRLRTALSAVTAERDALQENICAAIEAAGLRTRESLWAREAMGYDDGATHQLRYEVSIYDACLAAARRGVVEQERGE